MFLSATSRDKAGAGRELLRFAMGGGSGQDGGGSDGGSPRGAPVHDNTMVRIHGFLEKPSGGGLFRGEEWKPRYFVLRTDFVLEYFDPASGAAPPPWHHGLVGYQQVASHLGAVRGSYPLAQLGVQRARAEGPRLHVYLATGVRFGGKDVRELQFRATANDRKMGVPHASKLMEDWARAVTELADQQRRGALPGGPSQGSSPAQRPRSGCEAESTSAQWGSQMPPTATHRPQQWGGPPSQPFESSTSSWGQANNQASATASRSSAQADWSRGGQDWPQAGSMPDCSDRRVQELQEEVEQLRRTCEAERQRAEALERRVRELEAEKQNYANGGGSAYPTLSPRTSQGAAGYRPKFQRDSTVEAFQQQRPPAAQAAPCTVAQAMQLQRSSPAY